MTCSTRHRLPKVPPSCSHAADLLTRQLALADQVIVLLQVLIQLRSDHPRVFANGQLRRIGDHLEERGVLAFRREKLREDVERRGVRAIGEEVDFAPSMYPMRWKILSDGEVFAWIADTSATYSG